MFYCDFWNNFYRCEKEKGKLPQFCVLLDSKAYGLPPHWDSAWGNGQGVPSFSTGKSLILPEEGCLK